MVDPRWMQGRRPRAAQNVQASVIQRRPSPEPDPSTKADPGAATFELALPPAKNSRGRAQLIPRNSVPLKFHPRMFYGISNEQHGCLARRTLTSPSTTPTGRQSPPKTRRRLWCWPSPCMAGLWRRLWMLRDVEVQVNVRRMERGLWRRGYYCVGFEHPLPALIFSAPHRTSQAPRKLPPLTLQDER
ncbi:hypothetical protein FA13DRAFT_947370 [Coprinellus micaceus]|uniref:Uncharacterized protein n=1 Tax=Coprinellus micaceus TaxID=71717 RepID=A0A4Y7SZJ6_COPMI|nr:hypothetical protein FA13DRAFT_947370 [Coprinellus micaceus]